METGTFKIALQNGDFWTIDDVEETYNNIKEVEAAVDEFINDAQEAYTLELLSSLYTYDDIYVTTFNLDGSVKSVDNYLDFMAENDKDFNISLGV